MLKKRFFLILLFVAIVMLATSCNEYDLINSSDHTNPTQEAPPWDEELHEPNMLDVDFYSLSLKLIPWVGYDFGMTWNENGQIQIGHESFDKLAVKYDFIDMEFWSDHPCPDKSYSAVWLGDFMHWGFTITLRENDVIQEALNDLLKINILRAARYSHKLPKLEIPIFDESLHYPNELWITLNQGIFGFIELGFAPTKNDNGQIQIGHAEFDAMAIKYDFTEMRQLYLLQRDFSDENYLPIWYEHVKDYCRYYDFLITIADNETIEEVFQILTENIAVLRVSYRDKRSEQ